MKTKIFIRYSKKSIYNHSSYIFCCFSNKSEEIMSNGAFNFDAFQKRFLTRFFNVSKKLLPRVKIWRAAYLNNNNFQEIYSDFFLNYFFLILIFFLIIIIISLCPKFNLYDTDLNIHFILSYFVWKFSYFFPYFSYFFSSHC